MFKSFFRWVFALVKTLVKKQKATKELPVQSDMNEASFDFSEETQVAPDKTRVSFDCSEDAYQMLRGLAERIAAVNGLHQALSDASVVRLALRWMEWYLEELRPSDTVNVYNNAEELLQTSLDISLSQMFDVSPRQSGQPKTRRVELDFDEESYAKCRKLAGILQVINRVPHSLGDAEVIRQALRILDWFLSLALNDTIRVFDVDGDEIASFTVLESITPPVFTLD